MRNHPVVFTALASFFSLGCGEGVIEPATPDLSGDWQYTAALSVPEPLVCQILDATVTLAQRGLVLDGVINSVTLACGVSPDTVTLSNLELTEGVVRGDSLSFRFDMQSSQWSHRGRVTDDSLGGVVTVLTLCDPGPCSSDNVLTGTWGARRIGVPANRSMSTRARPRG